MDLRLHHIGILVKDIPKAALEYVLRLGYTIKSPVIHDPVQTAFVQFLKLRNDTASIELISPDSLKSKLSNALKKGGGLNHLCYETGNIESACKRLEAKGMYVLQQPVAAAAFPGRRIAWLMGRDGIPMELVETGVDDWR